MGTLANHEEQQRERRQRRMLLDAAIEAYRQRERRQLALARATQEHLVALTNLALHAQDTETRQEYWRQTAEIDAEFQEKADREGLTL